MILHGTRPDSLTRMRRAALFGFALVLLVPVPGAAPADESEPTTIEAKPRTLLGGVGDIWSVAISPDGKLLATGHGGGARRGAGSGQFWDTTTWKEVAYGQAHRCLAVSVSFSPDSCTLATAGMDGTAMLWNVPPQTVARKVK